MHVLKHLVALFGLLLAQGEDAAVDHAVQSADGDALWSADGDVAAIQEVKAASSLTSGQVQSHRTRRRENPERRRRKDHRRRGSDRRRRGKGGKGGKGDKSERRRRNGGNGGSRPTEPPKAKDFRYTCKPSTSWAGDFKRFAEGKDFCSCPFGNQDCGYVCAGGPNSNPGSCAADACSSGTYTFDSKNTWIIDVRKGGGPHRVFAYMPMGHSSWSGKQTLSFSFKTENFKGQKVYSKLFFWGDGNNVLGLLPPGHQMGGGQYRLIFMPNNDYPNEWEKAVPLEDDTWYRVNLVHTPPTSIAMSISMGGLSGMPEVVIGEGNIGASFASNHNGPQIGAYLWGQISGTYKIMLRDVCVGDSERM